MFSELIQPVLERRDLSEAQAQALMQYLLSGSASDAQIGGALLALRVKVCTTHELAAFARVMRAEAAVIRHGVPDLVDTCGTGGGKSSFNLSTGAAIVAAAAGAKIAKHGNRAVTSRCGSADVLEALGIRIGQDVERLGHLLDQHGIIFLFAPAHHPAMRWVGNARRELGVRTVFNQLGPLANPAGATRQLIGVYDPSMMRGMVEALRLLGAERALVVHGEDGLDEISPCAPTEFARWDGDQVTMGRFTPADFGMDPLPESALASGDTPEENAAILAEALQDSRSPRAHALVPNAAAALMLGGVANSLGEAAELARHAIADGRAWRTLDALRTDTGAM